MTKEQGRLKRRVFLKSAAATGGAAVAAGAARAGGEMIAPETTADTARPSARIAKAPKDYAESEQVKTYLRLARF